jgi:iron complex outermembrane receptor protein
MPAARLLRPDRQFKPVIRSALLSLVLIGVVCPFALAVVPVQLDSVAVRAYDIPPGRWALPFPALPSRPVLRCRFSLP